MRVASGAAVFLLLVAGVVRGADRADEEAQVRAADARFWQAYNACDMVAMGALLSEDVEFFHDRTGLTASRNALIESLRRGPCADPRMHLRRELVEGSLEFHPLAGGYAILAGRHDFHVQEAGKPERLDGQAAFTTVWQQADGRWRMYRVLSYDHWPAPYTPPQRTMALSPAQLARFAGRYRSARVGDIQVAVDGDHLRLVAGSFVATLHPRSPTVFFAMERDLEFEFEGEDGRALVVRENGTPGERAPRIE